MGLEFLRNYGAQRVRDYPGLPMMIGDAPDGDDVAEDSEGIDLDYEMRCDQWQARDTNGADGDTEAFAQGPWCPQRFIDGKDVGRTVAWLRSAEGCPVPVRLAEIGALALQNENGCLRRDFHCVERVVSMMADVFPWEDVEAFALDLQAAGFRLLLCAVPPKDVNPFDFEIMRQATYSRTKDEMIRLERVALSQCCDMPTIIDGRLETRAGAFAHDQDAVVGLVKTHSRNYLHTQGWNALYDLKPGQRTPVFQIDGRGVSVVTWYLRIDGGRGDMPNWGIVRVEAPRLLFEQRIGQDWNYVDRLSRLLCRCRTRDAEYGRSAVTIHPIQRAEESLGSLFTNGDTLISRFYHLTDL